MFPPSMIVFMVLYIVSFVLVINSDDWFLIWVGLELNMLSFIMLIYYKKSLNYIECCMKYFFVQSLGSAMLLGGFYLIENKFMYFGGLIMSYKMGAGPFYFWFPSVCSGLSWFACFFLMTIQKIIPLILMMLFVGWIFWGLVFTSLVFGAWGSLNQVNLKQLMAFSSIHHSGWMMLCVMMDSWIWVFYLVIYFFVIISVVMMMSYYEITNLMSLFKWKEKWLFSLSLLSMGGMPPFLGFYLKWISFYYIMKMDVSMIMIMIFMSIVMFYIYIRLIYDFMLSLGSEYSWYYKLFNTKLLNFDYFMIFGMLFSGMFGFLFLL